MLYLMLLLKKIEIIIILKDSLYNNHIESLSQSIQLKQSTMAGRSGRRMSGDAACACYGFAVIIALISWSTYWSYLQLPRDVTIVPLCNNPVEVEKIVPMDKDYLQSVRKSRYSGILPVSVQVGSDTTPSVVVTDEIRMRTKKGKQIAMVQEEGKFYRVFEDQKCSYEFQLGDLVCRTWDGKLEKLRDVSIVTIRWTRFGDFMEGLYIGCGMLSATLIFTTFLISS